MLIPYLNIAVVKAKNQRQRRNGNIEVTVWLKQCVQRENENKNKQMIAEL
jgi:hypothetical protein